MKLIKVFYVICFISVPFFAFSDGASTNEEQDMGEGNIETEDVFIPGFIFNSNNLLLDLDSYQGGVGVKFLFDSFALRGAVGGSYESAGELLSLNGGVAFEWPILTGRVIPYIGAAIAVNYEQEQSTNGEDWTRISSLIGGLGGIIGAELFVFEHLSVFAEYEVSGNISKSTITESVGGVETETSAINYQIATGLGNSASIGIVLYIKPVFKGKSVLVDVESK